MHQHGQVDIGTVIQEHDIIAAPKPQPKRYRLSLELSRSREACSKWDATVLGYHHQLM